MGSNAVGAANMSDRTMEKGSPKSDATLEPSASHPLDSWLRRELQGLCTESDHEPLPPGIAELAAQLEERLEKAGGDATRKAAPDPTFQRRGRIR